MTRLTMLYNLLVVCVMKVTLQVSGIALGLLDSKIESTALYSVVYGVRCLFPNNSIQTLIFKAVNCITVYSECLGRSCEEKRYIELDQMVMECRLCFHSIRGLNEK
jgi:hypothetical protein